MRINILPTKGEKFKAQRRREGLTQEKCAEKLGIKRTIIKYWEEGVPATPDVQIKLTKGELYFIIRERLGLKLKRAAFLMGISHITLIKLEKAKKDNHKILNIFYSEYIKKNNIENFN